jgi:hypothetical protein
LANTQLQRPGLAAETRPWGVGRHRIPTHSQFKSVLAGCSLQAASQVGGVSHDYKYQSIPVSSTSNDNCADM